MTQHTDAPWIQHPNHSNQILGFDPAENQSSATVAIVHAYDQETVYANARLIAAAPELLEALELADAALSGSNMNMNVVQKKVKSALAKAKGE